MKKYTPETLDLYYAVKKVLDRCGRTKSKFTSKSVEEVIQLDHTNWIVDSEKVGELIDSLFYEDQIKGVVVDYNCSCNSPCFCLNHKIVLYKRELKTDDTVAHYEYYLQ